MSRTKKNRKGQAALEYLMTYGWAIAVVLAVIVILAFVVRPQAIETCQLTSNELGCIDGGYVAYTNGTLVVGVKNIGYEQVRILQTACGLNDTDNTYINLKNINRPLTAGATLDVQFDCTGLIDATARVGQDVFQKDVYVIFNPRASNPNIIKPQVIRVAARYAPGTAPPAPAAVCGNSIIETGEQCDPSTPVCAPVLPATSCIYCGATCVNVTVTTP